MYRSSSCNSSDACALTPFLPRLPLLLSTAEERGGPFDGQARFAKENKGVRDAPPTGVRGGGARPGPEAAGENGKGGFAVVRAEGKTIWAPRRKGKRWLSGRARILKRARGLCGMKVLSLGTLSLGLFPTRPLTTRSRVASVLSKLPYKQPWPPFAHLCKPGVAIPFPHSG